MNKVAQLDFPIVAFVVLALGLLFFAPIGLKIFSSIRSNMTPALSNQSAAGGAAFDYSIGTLVSWWDKIIVFVFFVAILLLLISAFMIDTHPVWVVLYIFLAMMTVIFSNSVIKALGELYGTTKLLTAGELSQLPFTTLIYQNFGVFLTGVIVITGIIIYGKIAWFPSNSSGGRP
jgi:hypothetical protein